jgi:hypothetical protein
MSKNERHKRHNFGTINNTKQIRSLHVCTVHVRSISNHTPLRHTLPPFHPFLTFSHSLSHKTLFPQKTWLLQHYFKRIIPEFTCFFSQRTSHKEVPKRTIFESFFIVPLKFPQKNGSSFLFICSPYIHFDCIAFVWPV